METSAKHVRVARRLARIAVGLAVLLAAAAVLWLSGLAGDPEGSLPGPGLAAPDSPAVGPWRPAELPALGAEPLPVHRGEAAPPPPAPSAGLAPYPAGRDLDYLSPEALRPPAPRSAAAGDLDT